MAFKFNVSHNGKTVKYDLDEEELYGLKIGEKMEGKKVAEELEGYELEITGTSDKAGFPGFQDVNGSGLKKVLLKKGKGMHDKRKGVRLRKTIRGNELSADTVQVNTKVLKEGKTKFEKLGKKEEAPAEGEAPAENAEEPKKE